MKSVSLTTTATGSDSSHWPYRPWGDRAARWPKKPGGNCLLEARCARAALRGFPCLAGALALGRRFHVGIGGVFARVDVAQVAQQVHRLVIAEHDVHPAARRARLALQALQQVHDLARVGAAVEQVAEAHQVCAAGGPTVLAIDDAGLTQQAQQFGVGSVHVGKGHDTLDPAPLRLRRRRRLRPCVARDQHARDNQHWQPRARAAGPA